MPMYSGSARVFGDLTFLSSLVVLRSRGTGAITEIFEKGGGHGPIFFILPGMKRPLKML